MIGGLGAPEMLVILFVALLIFGPQNLPKLGSALGKTVKSIREGMQDTDAEPALSKASATHDESSADDSDQDR